MLKKVRLITLFFICFCLGILLIKTPVTPSIAVTQETCSACCPTFSIPSCPIPTCFRIPPWCRPTPTPTEPEPTPTTPEEPTPTPTTPEVTLTPTPTPTSPPEERPSPPVGGPPGPPVCGAEIPLAPILSVVKSGSEAELTWTVVDIATHYSILYGESSGNYAYGVDNTGKTTSFTVGGLDPAKDYCFAVRAVNGCAPSELSNEVCTGAVLGIGQVLGVTTLGPTGGAIDSLVQILFIIGSVCVSFGLRIFLPAKRKA